MIKDGAIVILLIIIGFLSYNSYTLDEKNIEQFNNDLTTIKNVGTIPNKNNYANALIPSKQAEFNNINYWNKEWKLETTTKYVNICSIDRNKALFPKSNHYTIHLHPPIRNVYSIQIIRGCIPKGEYTVNENNNIFVISKGPFKSTLQLVQGDYDIVTYIAMLNLELAPLNITATFNALLSKIQFTTPDPDTIIFHLNLERQSIHRNWIPK